MPRYTIPLSYTLTNTGGTADLIAIYPADDQVWKLRRYMISNGSEVAEAQEEDVRIQVKRLPATVTAGSGGSTFTVSGAGKVKRMATALSTGTVQYNDTTPASTNGTAETLEDFAWNVRATPYDSGWYEPDDQYDVKQSEALVITTPTTVADDMTLCITVWVEVEGVV